MCNLCLQLGADQEYKNHISDLYNKISERTKAAKNDLESVKEAISFSTPSFPLIDFAIFEPRMALQLPSNFYQNLTIDGNRLRNDWASGWTRIMGFKGDSLFLISHSFRRKETVEVAMSSYMVEFTKGEWSTSNEGGKIIISARDVEKSGVNFIKDTNETHKFSFTFIHQDTEHAIMPRDRVESSSLVRTIYHGHLPQKPLAFDYTEYVVTVPHLAPHSLLHHDWKKYGYKSAMDMQNAVTELLKQHLPK